ncbi:50S ribosomal protein L1 [Impatiens glandulifera]|uniref:50S ribosomal protein L1 n=1 Tax=Impatiens glandulifera TaxID=253017 RepID=UPI001FB0C515|nr:50S ribosomal protein L1 [Impatiens glandulifera]
MASFKLLLSHASRHCSSQYIHQLPRSSLTSLYRSLSSSPSVPEPNSPESRSNEPKPLPIQSVSYAVKPKDPPPPAEEQTEDRAWSREDIRYMKDIPKITPVSYASKVAPLPEDREADSKEGETGEVDEQLERERRRIEVSSQVRRRLVRVEDNTVPFPTLIKQVTVKEKTITTIHDLQEAIKLLKANAKTTFDETVEVHVNLAAELRRSDLKLNGTANLPHGTGKVVKIAVFADGTDASEAREAGADVVGSDDLIEEIKNGNFKVDFDTCITTPKFFPRLKKIATVLKRLMPNIKDRTLTADVAKAVTEAKQCVYIKKRDKRNGALVNAGIGKVSFSEQALRENIGAFLHGVLLAKPAGLKKSSRYAGYVNSVHICSTMGAGYPVSMQSVARAADRYSKTLTS